MADLVLETRQPIAFDLTADSEATGRFVIVDGYDVAGGGIIVEPVADEHEDARAEARLRDFNWVRRAAWRAEERAQRFGHRPALVMFVGKSGTGKHRYARALEKALFGEGRNAYMLDGTNVLLGVDQDLYWVDATQHELVRRFAEVAHLMLRRRADRGLDHQRHRPGRLRPGAGADPRLRQHGGRRRSRRPPAPRPATCASGATRPRTRWSRKVRELLTARQITAV